MNKITDTSAHPLLACDDGFDPIEDRLRANIRSTIEAVFSEELDGFLGRLRYGREAGAVKGYRHGHRDRQITGTFGTETISVPRARVENEDGKVREWSSKALPRYRRLTKTAEALIASVYLSGTNTRRVKRALHALFKGAVSKDVVSRAWRKVKSDRDAWCARSLADEDIVRARRRQRGSDRRPSGSNRWRHDGRPPPLATPRTVVHRARTDGALMDDRTKARSSTAR